MDPSGIKRGGSPASAYITEARNGTDGPEDEHKECPVCGAPLVWQPFTMSMASQLDEGYHYCSRWPACSGIVNDAISGVFKR